MAWRVNFINPQGNGISGAISVRAPQFLQCTKQWHGWAEWDFGVVDPHSISHVKCLNLCARVLWQVTACFKFQKGNMGQGCCFNTSLLNDLCL